jgi:hypothetical protein
MAPWAGKRLICAGDYQEPNDLPRCLRNNKDESESDGSEVESADLKLNFYFNQKYRKIKPSRNLPQPVLQALTLSGCSIDFPEHMSWVLCNLTTQGYVRAEALPCHPSYPCGPDLPIIGFGEVLLSHICWSSDPSTAMRGNPIHRGRWAGHRFKITTIDEVAGKEGWKDVSDRVVNKIETVWTDEFGKAWKEKLMYRGV